ncbi:hypothetical protein VTO73DRAFT_13899 [Trametes versicolor]
MDLQTDAILAILQNGLQDQQSTEVCVHDRPCNSVAASEIDQGYLPSRALALHVHVQQLRGNPRRTHPANINACEARARVFYPSSYAPGSKTILHALLPIRGHVLAILETGSLSIPVSLDVHERRVHGFTAAAGVATPHAAGCKREPVSRSPYAGGRNGCSGGIYVTWTVLMYELVSGAQGWHYAGLQTTPP